jgi:hypothetical protein
MERTVALALNKFPIIPHSVREVPNTNTACPELSVPLASLYHHYYLDSHGKVPPDPDPAQFEHLQFLLPTKDFRIQGDGIGKSTSIRRHRSNELGHAFCRWFLHDHLNITYFAHMEHVLRRSLHRAFAGYRVERTSAGDTPDYFCAESVDKIFLSEAKGRYSSVSFRSAEFNSWRAQFDRVAIKDRAGHARSVKGYIVATRFATETKPTIKSTIFAEDPQTHGDGPLGPEDAFELGATVISAHYADIAAKLNQPILASALSNGFAVPDEILFPVTIWTFQIAPLKGLRFVGGYYPSGEGSLPLREVNGRIIFDVLDPLRLDVARGTFFGVEEKIFRQVIAVARGGTSLVREINHFELIQPFYSAISVLRDGSVIGPVEFFQPVQQATF